MAKTKIFIAALALFLFGSSAFAQDSPYNFLRFLGSARSTALAGCFVSMPEDPNAVFYNPATIYTVEEKPFTATFMKHVLDINSGVVAYVRQFDENGGKWAGSIGYVNYGSFDAANTFGELTGTFGANDVAMQVSYSNELDTNLYWGATAKLIFVNIEDVNSFAAALDAGLLYRLPDGRSNVGLSILHAGAQLSKFSGVSESLPIDIRLGINHRLRGLPLLVNFSLHHLADETDDFFEKLKNFSIGGELYIGEYVMLRAGYDNQIRQFTSIETDRKLAGFSFGAGVKLENFNIDYGLALMGASANFHKFSVNMNL